MHAFLILAHADPTLCTRLAARLADAGEVFVHIDAKVDDTEFAPLKNHAHVLPSRVPVRWGGWSMVRAIDLLGREALRNPDIDALTLVSGSHYPLIAPREIAAAPKRDRISLIPSPDAGAGKPIEKFDRRYVARFDPGSAASIVSNAAARRLPALNLQGALSGRRLYAGSTWWSLTRGTYEQAMATIDVDDRLRSHFSRVVAPDECLMHTAVGDVLERQHGRPATELVDRETTYVLWDGGRHPEPLTPQAVDTGREAGWWFGRKFSSEDPALLAYAESGWR